MQGNRHTRRRVIASISTAAGVGLAGCLGDDSADDTQDDDDTDDTTDDGDDNGVDDADEGDWPIETLELVTPLSPGGGLDTHQSGAVPLLQELFPSETQVLHGTYPGAGGIVAENRTYNADLPENPRMIMQEELALFLNSTMEPELTDYEVTDWVDTMVAYRRPPLPGAWVVNKHTFGTEESFSWTWSDWVENLPDMVYGATDTADMVTLRAVEYFSDELEVGTTEAVMYDGSVRPAMLRGEVDIYNTGMGSAIAPDRTEEYWTGQLVLGHTDYNEDLHHILWDMVESAYETHDVVTGETPRLLNEMGYSSEGAQNVARLAQDYAWFLTPGVSDEVYDNVVEIVDEFLHMPEWLAFIEDTRGGLEGTWWDVTGQEASEMFSEKVSVFQEVFDEIPEDSL